MTYQESRALAVVAALEAAPEGGDLDEVRAPFVGDDDATFPGGGAPERAVGVEEARRLLGLIPAAPGSFELRARRREARSNRR